MKKISKKSAKKQHAMKHGAYSREAMLPGEKWSDYEALRAAHYDELAPDGIIEECLVDDLITLRWKKRRMDQYDQIRLKQRFARIHKANERNRHRANLKSLAAEIQEATSCDEVEKILSVLSPLYNETLKVWVPSESCEDLAHWGVAVAKFLSELKIEEHLEGEDIFAVSGDPNQ